jgi:pimeloyl-ACP methyl ester carboxylesterase
VPVLVLLGERAPWADTTTAALSSLGPEPRKLVRSKRLKGSGAFPMLERREQSVEAIEDFFDLIED